MLNFLKRRKRRTLVAGGAVLALVFAGVAFAVWTFTQQSSAFEAQTGNTLTLTIVAPTAGDLAAATACFPGGSCPILAEVSNASSTPITLTSYQASSANGFADTNSNCTVLTGPAEGITSVPISPGIVVPANATNQVVTIPNALSLPANAPTSCQNKLIQETSGHVTLTFTAGS